MNIIIQESGFSLIELLVSVTIIGLLVTSSFLGFKEIKKRASDMVLIQTASDLMKAAIISHVDYQEAISGDYLSCFNLGASYTKMRGTDLSTSNAALDNEIVKNPFLYYTPTRKLYASVIFSREFLIDTNIIDVRVGDCSTKRWIITIRNVECNNFKSEYSYLNGTSTSFVQDMPGKILAQMCS